MKSFYLKPCNSICNFTWKFCNSIWKIVKSSVRNREVLLRVTDCHAQRRPCTGVHGTGFWTHSRPLSLCQDDINLILTCFNNVIKIVFKTYILFLYIEFRYCQHLPWHGLTFEIKYAQSMITQIHSWETKIIKMSVYNISEYKYKQWNSKTLIVLLHCNTAVFTLSYVKCWSWTLRNWLDYYINTNT